MNATAQQAIAIAKAKKVMDWAISSQAARERVEGSTTSSSSPDRANGPRARGSMAYKRLTGVYAIRHAETDSVYIGSAVSVLARIAMHRRDLRNGAHPNSFLQGMYDKYGELQFELVEECPRELLRQREQAHIDNAEGRLMNLARQVCELAPPEIHSARMKAAWRRRSDENRAEIGKKISATLRRRYASNQDFRDANSARLAAARASDAFKDRHQSAQANEKRAAATRKYWEANTQARSESIKAAMRKLSNVHKHCSRCSLPFVGTAAQKWCSPRCRVAACKAKAKAKAC